MKIGIVGAGGVGGMLAGFLLSAGHSVYLSARSEHAKAIKESGIRVEIQGKKFVETPTAVLTENLSLFSNCEIIILTVKMYDLEAVCSSLIPHHKAETTVVTMQNGVEAIATACKFFSKENVAGGSIVTSARVESPGLIIHEGPNNKVTLENKNDIVRAFHDALIKAGVGSELSDDIQAVLWKKLIRLASVSGVTCLTKQPYGWVMKTPAAEQFLLRLVEEAYSVGRAFGVNLPQDTVKVCFEGIKANCGENFKPSMLLDLERGKRLEVKYLSGAISRLGKDRNVPTPCSDAVAVALGPYENGI